MVEFTQYKERWIYAALLLVFGALIFAGAYYARYTSNVSVEQTDPFAAGQVGLMQYRDSGVSVQQCAYTYIDSDDEVYSFLQGPKSWNRGVPWSGEWCMYYEMGHYFGAFGCGFCCIANIYSTLTPYTCSPLDAYEYAQIAGGYTMSYQSAAISWGSLKMTLRHCGFACDVYYKPDTYEEFVENIANCESAIVLVCSANDDTFWEDTPGHYVNIWNYEASDGTVFLCEPGSPTNNRARIPLYYVYNALKTTSKFQYLMVLGYDEAANEWKHDGIQENWIVP